MNAVMMNSVMRDVAAENHEEFVSVENVNSKGKHIINSNIHSVIDWRAG